MTPEEFRKRGHQLIDWIADYRALVSDLPVMARTAPGLSPKQLIVTAAVVGAALVFAGRGQKK